ncbi:MAG: hypothetical protein GXP41_06065 [Chloroflexi bacterium]|nr:hypothetical protein [Chloroflexota bacterium]
MEHIEQHLLAAKDGEPVQIAAELHLESCGMGMPVIRSWQLLKTLPVNSVMLVTSSHP